MQSNFNEALTHWGKAMEAIKKFPVSSGRTTRMIIEYISHTLLHLGQIDTMRQSLEQIQMLDELAKPDSVKHWIAGTQYWLDYLRTLGSHL
jgi:hypothetical protein